MCSARTSQAERKARRANTTVTRQAYKRRETHGFPEGVEEEDLREYSRRRRLLLLCHGDATAVTEQEGNNA